MKNHNATPRLAGTFGPTSNGRLWANVLGSRTHAQMDKWIEGCVYRLTIRLVQDQLGTVIRRDDFARVD
jgi:hypothetical protein